MAGRSLSASNSAGDATDSCFHIFPQWAAEWHGTCTAGSTGRPRVPTAGKPAPACSTVGCVARRTGAQKRLHGQSLRSPPAIRAPEEGGFRGQCGRASTAFSSSILQSAALFSQIKEHCDCSWVLWSCICFIWL